MSLVRILVFWYNDLSLAVIWNGVTGEYFKAVCGVRQGGVLSPYLYSLYVDELIDALRSSGFGIYVGKLFAGCICYADVIILIACSCYGFQRMVDICGKYGHMCDIAFNISYVRELLLEVTLSPLLLSI